MSTDEVLDREAVAELRKAAAHLGSPTLVGDLVALYGRNAPRRLDEIRAAVAAGDAPSLERAAHTLKSNCAVFGARSMSACCARLEDAAGRADFGETGPLLAELEREFARVLEAVAALGVGRQAPDA